MMLQATHPKIRTKTEIIRYAGQSVGVALEWDKVHPLTKMRTLRHVYDFTAVDRIPGNWYQHRILKPYTLTDKLQLYDHSTAKIVSVYNPPHRVSDVERSIVAPPPLHKLFNIDPGESGSVHMIPAGELRHNLFVVLHRRQFIPLPSAILLCAGCNAPFFEHLHDGHGDKCLYDPGYFQSPVPGHPTTFELDTRAEDGVVT